MPQLDKVTFISQLFWLFLTFLTFYVVTLNVLLPKISQILKVRKKRINSSNEGMSSYQEEESLIIKHYDEVLASSLKESRDSLIKTTEFSTNWLNESIKETNKTALLDMNKEYIKTIGDISGKKHIIQDCIHQTK